MDQLHCKTVLAIASAGGHWVQLRRLHPAFENVRIIYATTKKSYRDEVLKDKAEFRVVPDCNRWEKFKLLKCAIAVFFLILREKPDTVITTGAAPGYFAIRLGKLLGKRTAWVDSIANAEELSMSGQKAGHHAELWITQWKHLAKEEGPCYFGNVLGVGTSNPEQPTIQSARHHLIFNGHSPREQHAATLSNSDTNTEFAKTETAHGALLASKKQSKEPLKIFITVGTDLPFDRLVKAIDEWSTIQDAFEIFAQIGKTSWKPNTIAYEQFLEPPEFKKRFLSSDLVISHAGMGTILSSLQYQKPLLVMPRIASKGEHRNEHQLATAKHLKKLNKVNVAADEIELIEILNDLSRLEAREPIGPYASDSLINSLKHFVHE